MQAIKNMGTDKLVADVATVSGSDDGEERMDNKRTVHNEVERRRKIKINHWIYRLGELLPGCSHKKTSKNWILERAVAYVKELQDTNEKLILGHCAEVQGLVLYFHEMSHLQRVVYHVQSVTEFRSLKSRIHDLEKRNSELVRLMETSNTTLDISDIWQTRPKYSHKISSDSLARVCNSSKLSPIMSSQIKPANSLLADHNSKATKSILLGPFNKEVPDVLLMSTKSVMTEKSGKDNSKSAYKTLVSNTSSLTCTSPESLQVSKLHNVMTFPTCAVSTSLTLNGNVTAVTQALPGLPIMSTNPHTTGNEQLVQHVPQHLPVLNYGNTVNIFSGLSGQSQPMIIINEQGIPLLHNNILPNQIVLNPQNGSAIGYVTANNLSGSLVAENSGRNCASVSGQIVCGNGLDNTTSGPIILNTATVAADAPNSSLVHRMPNGALTTELPTFINTTIGHPILNVSLSGHTSGQIIITSSSSDTNVTRSVPVATGDSKSSNLNSSVSNVISPISVFEADRTLHSFLGDTSFLATSNSVKVVPQPMPTSVQKPSLPSALLLPNGQIIPVVSQPSLIYPGSAPISGSLLMAPSLLQSGQPFTAPKIFSEELKSKPKSNFISVPITFPSNSKENPPLRASSATTIADTPPVITESSTLKSSVVCSATSPNEFGGSACIKEYKKRRCQRAIKPKPISQCTAHTNENKINEEQHTVSQLFVSCASATYTTSPSENLKLQPSLQAAKNTEVGTDILAKATESIFSASTGEVAPCVSNICHREDSNYCTKRSNSQHFRILPAVDSSHLDKKKEKCDSNLINTSNSLPQSFNIGSSKKSTAAGNTEVAAVCNSGNNDAPLLQPISPVISGQSLPSEAPDRVLKEPCEGKSVPVMDEQLTCLNDIVSEASQKMSESLQKRNSSAITTSDSPASKRSRCMEHKSDEIRCSTSASSVSFLSVSQLASSSFSIDTTLCADNSPLGSISPLLASPIKSASSDGFLGTAAASNQFDNRECTSNEDTTGCVHGSTVAGCSPASIENAYNVGNTNTKLKRNLTIEATECDVSSKAVGNVPVTAMMKTFGSNCAASSYNTSTPTTKSLTALMTETNLGANLHFDTSVNECSLQRTSNFLADNQVNSSAAESTTFTSNLSALPRITQNSSTGVSSLSDSIITAVTSNHTYAPSSKFGRNSSIQDTTFEADLQVTGAHVDSVIMNATLPPAGFSTNSLTSAFNHNVITSGQALTESTLLPMDGVIENVPSFGFGQFSPVTTAQQQLIIPSSHASVSQPFSQNHCLTTDNTSRHLSLESGVARTQEMTASNDATKNKEIGNSNPVVGIVSSEDMAAQSGVRSLGQSQALNHTPPQPEIVEHSQQPQPGSPVSPVFQPQRSGAVSTNYSAEALISHSLYPTASKDTSLQRHSRAGISYSAESLIQNQLERRPHCSQSGHLRQHTNALSVTNQFSGLPSYSRAPSAQTLPHLPLQTSAEKPNTTQSDSLPHFQHGKNACLISSQQNEIFSFSLAQHINTNGVVPNNQMSNVSTRPVTTYPNLFHYPHSAPVLHNSKQPLSMQGVVGFPQQSDCSIQVSHAQPQLCSNNRTYSSQHPMFQGHFVSSNPRGTGLNNSSNLVLPDKIKGKHDAKNSKVGKHAGQSKKKSYSIEEVNLSNSIFETNRSVTPFFGIPTLSPPRNEAPTYIPNPSNIFTASNRQISASKAQQPKSAEIGTPYNPLFTSRSQSGLNLNFQAPGFGVNHIRCNTTATQLTTHSNFNLSNIFPEIGNSGDNLNVSSVKFHPANTMLGTEPQPHQTTTLYNRPVLHNSMSINSLLAQNAHGFDGRPPVPGAINNAMTPPTFHGHNHTASFSNVIPALNFPVHDH